MTCSDITRSPTTHDVFTMAMPESFKEIMPLELVKDDFIILYVSLVFGTLKLTHGALQRARGNRLGKVNVRPFGQENILRRCLRSDLPS